MEGIIKINSSNYSEATVENESAKILISGYENIGNVFNGDYVNVIDNKCSLIKSNISNKIILRK